MLWIKSDDQLKIIVTHKIAAGATVKEGNESSYPPLKKRFSLLLIFKYFTVKSTVCCQQGSFIDSKKRNIKTKKAQSIICHDGSNWEHCLNESHTSLQKGVYMCV